MTEFIPLFPLGRPVDPEMQETLVEVFTYARVDLMRAVEPPLGHQEVGPQSRPPDGVVMERFMAHASRMTALSDKTVLAFPWRREHTVSVLFQQLELLQERVRTFSVGPDARHVFFIEDTHAAFTFTEATRILGVLSGELNQGGVLISPIGRWFVITANHTITRADLGHRLAAFLRQHLTENERPTLSPPADPVEFAAPAISALRSSPRSSPRRSGSSHTLRAVNPSSPPDSVPNGIGSKRRP